MDGTTPPGPPEGLGSRGPGGSGASGRDDLLFPAAADGRWRSDDRPDSRSRWVLVAAVACYRLPTDERGSDGGGTVDVTSCTEPHDGQVYARVPLAFDDYPSDAALTTAAESACGDADSTLDPSVASSDVMSPSWYAPLEADWADSAHSATCVVESNDPNGLTRSWTTSP